MKKSKLVIIGTLALAFGLVLANCEHRAEPDPDAGSGGTGAAAGLANNPAFGSNAIATDEKTVTVNTTTIATTVTVPKGVTLSVANSATLTVNGELIGESGATVVIGTSASITGTGANNFYMAGAPALLAADQTYVWVSNINGYGFDGWVLKN